MNRHEQLARGCETRLIATNGVTCRVVTRGDGPLVLMVHGFPELWSSWRHQFAPIADAGFLTAAMDVRGYGGSSKPHPIDAYDLKHLAGDVAGLIDILGGGRAVLVGHDWGAAIVYAAAFLYPEKIRGIAGLAAPFLPPLPAPPISLMHEVFKDRFFYQLYFQTEGVAEREFQRDIRTWFRKFFYALSGDAGEDRFRFTRPEADADLVSALPYPERMPKWFSHEEEDYWVDNFTASGLRGPLNRYRCVDRDWHDLKPFAERKIPQPSLFIGGAKDPVRSMNPATDGYAAAHERLADCRGIHIVDGAGHWVQQEAPEPANRYLIAFLKGLD